MASRFRPWVTGRFLDHVSGHVLGSDPVCRIYAVPIGVSVGVPMATDKCDRFVCKHSGRGMGSDEVFLFQCHGGINNAFCARCDTD